MRISDDSRDYDCAPCAHTGGVCLEALSLCQRVAHSLEARADDLPDSYFLRSHTVFHGCGHDCTAILSLSDTCLDIACSCPGTDAAPSGARVSATRRGAGRPTAGAEAEG